MRHPRRADDSFVIHVLEMLHALARLEGENDACAIPSHIGAVQGKRPVCDVACCALRESWRGSSRDDLNAFLDTPSREILNSTSTRPVSSSLRLAAGYSHGPQVCAVQTRRPTMAVSAPGLRFADRRRVPGGSGKIAAWPSKVYYHCAAQCTNRPTDRGVDAHDGPESDGTF